MRSIKSSPYNAFVDAYPLQSEVMRNIIEREREHFAAVRIYPSELLAFCIDPFFQDRNLGLVHQALERAPRWHIKQLTATYVTLNLSDIAKTVGIPSEDEVQAIVMDMVHRPFCF